MANKNEKLKSATPYPPKLTQAESRTDIKVQWNGMLLNFIWGDAQKVWEVNDDFADTDLGSLFQFDCNSHPQSSSYTDTPLLSAPPKTQTSVPYAEGGEIMEVSD